MLGPEEVDRLLGVLNTDRDRAMVLAMLLGGLRRCEVLGLRLADLSPGERRMFVAEGKGGHQRLIPVSSRFFAAVCRYLDLERPAADHDRLFVALRGPRRGLPFSPAGLDQILKGARDRAALERLTCHQLRHTCLTRLREAGMALGRCRHGRPSLDRIDAGLSASGQRVAGRAVRQRDRRDRRRPRRARRRHRGRTRLMPRELLLGAGCHDLVERYLDYLDSVGMGTDHKLRWGARAFLAKIGDLQGFSALPVQQQ